MTAAPAPEPDGVLAALHRESPAEDLRAAYESHFTVTIAQLAAATERPMAWVRERLYAADTRMRPRGRRARVRNNPEPAVTVTIPAEQCRTDTATPMQPSATVHRHVLTHRLRTLRTQAGLTQRQAAHATEVSQTTVMRAENPASSLTVDVLRSLCALYKVTPELCAELLSLWHDSQAPEWWTTQHLQVPENERAAVGLRADARKVHGWADLLVPDLLQTASYARVVERMVTDEETAEMAVSVRLAAQRRARDRGIAMRYVVDEGILRRWVGGTQVMADQLDALRVHASQGRLRVLAFDTGSCVLDAFELSSVPGLADEVLYVPGSQEIHIGDPPPPTYSLQVLRDAMARVWEKAEDTDASVAMINDSLTRMLTTSAPPARPTSHPCRPQ